MKLIFLALFITGCGAWDRTKANFTGDASEVCHDGIVYLQFTSGSSVKYDQTGKIVTCK